MPGVEYAHGTVVASRWRSLPSRCNCSDDASLSSIDCHCRYHDVRVMADHATATGSDPRGTDVPSSATRPRPASCAPDLTTTLTTGADETARPGVGPVRV
jgi:hypothetical protein